MKARTTTSIVGGLLLASTMGLTSIASPAHASLINLGGKFIAKIDVAQNGAAVGTVSDTISTDSTYYTVLTATGGGTCSLLSPTVVITDVDYDGFSNPSMTSTEGACNLYNATVEYTLTWTSILGTTGVLPVTCDWVLGTKTCTLQGATGDVSRIIQTDT